jgi:hypothetical protein
MLRQQLRRISAGLHRLEQFLRPCGIAWRPFCSVLADAWRLHHSDAVTDSVDSGAHSAADALPNYIANCGPCNHDDAADANRSFYECDHNVGPDIDNTSLLGADEFGFARARAAIDIDSVLNHVDPADDHDDSVCV